MNTDFRIRGPRLPERGTTVRGGEFQEAPGGKGANQAVAAARLGARATLVARIGTDARGRVAVRRLDDEHVNTAGVSRDVLAPTGAALIMVDDAGEKMILTAPGANLKLREMDIATAAELVSRARVLLAQLEVPLDTVGSAVRLGRSAGARVVLDPSPPVPLRDELLREIDVVRCNGAEAEVLTGVAVRDVDSARAAALSLLARGAGAACIAVPGGNLLVSSTGGETWLPHLPVKAIDKTGAGDAFAGGLATALAEGQTLEDAARFGSAAAALKTQKLGAQAGLPFRKEVLALLDRGGAGPPHASVHG